MGAQFSTHVERQNLIDKEIKTLQELEESFGCNFPGSDHHPTDRKNWISGLDPEKVHMNQIVWPGTHNSGTNHLGVESVTRPFGECQSLSIYEQLILGTRLLDIRVNENREVCHGILVMYNIDIVIHDVKKFISETESEIIILEIRTEYGHIDPPEFEKYLEQQLGEYLIHQDDQVFEKTVGEILPKRIICIWKPRNSDMPKPGGPFWGSGYLKNNWIDTDLPATKFEGNMQNLSQQPSVSSRKYFYRVENTLTAQKDNLVLDVKSVTNWIHGYARLFIAQCFAKNIADRLQVYSTDFIDEDFVDACVGLTWARIQGKA